MSKRFLGLAGLGSAAVVFGLGVAFGPAWADEPPTGESKPVVKPLPADDARNSARAGQSANDGWLRYDGPRLRYEQPRFGGDARLFVREDLAPSTSDGSVAPTTTRWRVYRGRDLDVITKANVDLATAADLPTLRTYLETNAKSSTEPMRIAGAVRTSVEAPNFVYEPSTTGTSGTARFYVRDAAGRETLYTGSSFDTIVRANPTFEQLDGFQDFRTRVQLVDSSSPWVLRSDASTLLNINHTPSGVVVATNEWRDGRWVTRTHQGRTLAEIQASQADLRALLDSREGVAPMAGPTALVNPAWHVQPFGVSMEAPPTCLDSQLKLEGRGVVVTDVREGSDASTLGLRSNDVIVEYDGRPVTDGEWVRSQFASWRSDSRPKLVVLRRGSRMTLGR